MRNILEGLQWILIAAVIGFVVHLIPICQNERRQMEKEDIYRQIYNDQRLEKLKRENMHLSDSIGILNKKGDIQCTIPHYIVVKDTIYISDTIFLAENY